MLRKYVYLSVASSDLDVLERFQEIVECGKIYSPKVKKPSHHKAVHYWACYKRVNVLRVIDLFLPWLGMRRRQRIEECLQGSEVLWHSQ